MNARSIVSPEDQGATFVELFFDLVFVFAITQVTHYAAHHLDVHGLVRAALVFWLIWWGWTQYTWALNAANTDHHHVRVATLVATALAFVMAASVEKAFSEVPVEALTFAVAYLAVRVVGLALYYRVTFSNEAQQSAVFGFALLSASGLAAVLVGAFVAPSMREWLFGLAIVLDVGAALKAGSQAGAWGLHAGHFAERHGLIVIIALGESLIVAGSALTDGATPALLLTGAAAVVVTCLLWWTYFGWIREVVEETLIEASSADRTPLGRDAYSLLHFPLVTGIIALAVGFEAAFHPGDYSTGATAAAVGGGLAMFLGSTTLVLWRAAGCVLWSRLLLLAVTLLAILLSASSSGIQILAVAGAGLALIVAVEQVTVRRQLGKPA